MKSLRLFSIVFVTMAAAAALAGCGSSSSSSSSPSAGGSAASGGGGSGGGGSVSGGSGGGGSAGSGGSVSGAQLQARVNVARCLRSHGIDVPDPGPSGPSPGEMQRLQQQYSPSQLQAGLKACQSSLAQAFPQLSNPAVLAQRRQQALQFARCMRSHGIDIPDPPSSGPGLGIGRALRSVDQNSPKFKSANSACESLRPTGSQG